MQRKEAQRSQARNQPAVRQEKGAAVESPQSQRIAQLEALAEGSPQATRQRQLAAMIGTSSTMAAQRQKFEGMFSGAAQRQEDEELLQGRFETAQRVEEEEFLQGKFAVVQRVEEDELLQGKFPPQAPAQLKEESVPKTNNTGLPDNLKSGIESLSGMSLDNVKVHYNSAQPAQLNALAYAQGTDIHVAPGREQHLPHEAWHVVQQAQGRVKPTMQMRGGVPVNDDQGLEHEADVMGAKAIAGVAQSVAGGADENSLASSSVLKTDNKTKQLKGDRYYWVRPAGGDWQYVGSFKSHAAANKWWAANKGSYPDGEFGQGGKSSYR